MAVWCFTPRRVYDPPSRMRAQWGNCGSITSVRTQGTTRRHCTRLQKNRWRQVVYKSNQKNNKMGSYVSRRRTWYDIDDCCGRSPAHSPSSSRSPSPVRSYVYCANMACCNSAKVEKISDWCVARIGDKREFRFCSRACWKEWLEMPGYMGSWHSPLSQVLSTPSTVANDSPEAKVPEGKGEMPLIHI